MNVNEFLGPEEVIRVKGLLMRSSLLMCESAGDRRAWLNDIPSNFSTLDFSGSALQFLTRLWSFLGERELAAPGGARKLGVIVLLEYLIKYEAGVTQFSVLNKDEVDELSLVVEKYEEWLAQQPPRPREAEIAAALKARRQRTAAPAPEPEPAAAAPLDADAVFRFDLRKQVGCVYDKLRPAGAFPFTTGGRQDLLERYVVERIQRDVIIRPEQKRTFSLVKVHLLANLLGQELSGTVLEQEIREGNEDVERLTDFFRVPHTDVLLIVWNHDVPLPEARQIAESFWASARAQLEPGLKNNSSRLIFLWANLDGLPLDSAEFHAIPPLECFELTEIEDYFRDYLGQVGLPPAKIDKIIRRLSRHKGQLPGTYLEMKWLVEDYMKEADRV